jgi:oligopeptide transport system ATP-binding protein
MTIPLLVIKDLEVRFGAFAAVRDVDFHIDQGETVALVGESGSGKSSVARALLRLVPAAAGHVYWQSEDLLTLERRALRARRRDMQIIFQDPLASLNPRMTVEQALAEPLKIFEPHLGSAARRARIVQMLERVGLSAVARHRYPHEFSGGQCQRIGIARAMILRPRFLVCDEPVSSLDVSIQGQIVNLLVDLQNEWGTAMLFISHNLAVVRHLSHRVLVMFRGRLIESATRDDLFAAPAHPYTRALLAAVPSPSAQAVKRISMVGAEAAGAGENVNGCAFFSRCPFARPVCLQSVPKLESTAAGHQVACHRWREVVYSSLHETRTGDSGSAGE